MDAHQFLAAAEELAASARKDPAQPNARAICRTAVGRAYYSLFLLSREFVSGLGFETRSVPSIHVLVAEALQSSGVLTLKRISETLNSLRAQRTDADYEMGNTAVETVANAEDVVAAAKAATLQLDIIRAGRITPPIDRVAVTTAILRWAEENSKPLWKKA